ncbi:hypothetical protein FB451DRAFT_393832 [Mycena latifolia]|nr:hypothetical protein FB451DRAFT_393832 [Mycena latifolia]
MSGSLWGVDVSGMCILPIPDSKEYFNEDQRNIHVWMSEAPVVMSPRHSKHIRLLAGAFVGPPPMHISTKVFYDWMRYICYPGVNKEKLVDSVNFYDDDHDSPDQYFRLLRLDYNPHSDPRGVPSAQDFHRFEPIRSSDNVMMKKGHYILVKVSVAFDRFNNPVEVFKACSVDHLDPAITQRTLTRGVTMEGNTKSVSTKRSETTRKEVRLRDMQCRVSGQPARRRHRGRHFAGLEVAHIFPLGEIDKFTKAFDFGDQSNRTLVYHSLGITEQPKASDIDIPANAFVLRGDLHTQFDGYEYGFELNRGPDAIAKPVRIRLFEKDGAPSVPRTDVLPLRRSEGVSANVANVNKALLTHHYLTGVLWHVAGNGRPPVKDALEVRTDLEVGHAKTASVSTSQVKKSGRK